MPAVHAYGQVVNFFTDGRIPTDRIVRAVNSLLPPDIVVRAAGEADRDFSARHSAKSKTYIYRIQRGEVPDPMTARYAWYIRRPLDVAAMREALGSILGTHDFSAFRASGGAPMSPVRTMYEAAVEEAAGNQLVCRIHGNGFLYHMVRNIIGTVANVGLGIITPQRFQEILDGCDRTKAAATAGLRPLPRRSRLRRALPFLIQQFLRVFEPLCSRLLAERLVLCCDVRTCERVADGLE